MAEDLKRREERLEILGELQGEVMVFQRLTIKEISRTGIRVETSFPLQLDSLHDLRVALADRAIVAKARVAHCSIADVGQEEVTYTSGLEFIEPSDRVVQAISDFIETIREGRRAGSAST